MFPLGVGWPVRLVKAERHVKDFSPFTLEGWYIFQLFEWDRHGVTKRGMRSEEVIVSNEEGGKSDSAVASVESAGSSCMELVGTDEPFDELFKRPKLFRFRVKVLEAYDFFMREFWNTGLVKEVNTGWVGRVTVSDKFIFLVRFRGANSLTHSDGSW